MDMFDHPNVFIVEVDNPDLDTSMPGHIGQRLSRTASLHREPGTWRVVSHEKLDTTLHLRAKLQAYADNKRFKKPAVHGDTYVFTGPSPGSARCF